MKATALLNASADAGHDTPFGSHRDQAVHSLEWAQEQMQKAREYADSRSAGGSPSSFSGMRRLRAINNSSSDSYAYKDDKKNYPS